MAAIPSSGGMHEFEIDFQDKRSGEPKKAMPLAEFSRRITFTREKDASFTITTEAWGTKSKENKEFRNLTKEQASHYLKELQSIKSYALVILKQPKFD